MRERVARLAALALGLTLAVVLASAAIRLGARDPAFAALLPALRIVHRASASLEVLVALWLALIAWRARIEIPRAWRAALIVLALTLALSIVGVIGGQNPPPAIVLANLIGGLALACVFSVLGSCAGAAAARLGRAVIFLVAGLLALQIALGAAVSIGAPGITALALHGALAMPLVALLLWVSLARSQGAAGRLLLAAALAAPLAGMSALHFVFSPGAAIAHAASAALLACAAAFALARVA